MLLSKTMQRKQPKDTTGQQSLDSLFSQADSSDHWFNKIRTEASDDQTKPRLSEFPPVELESVPELPASSSSVKSIIQIPLSRGHDSCQSVSQVLSATMSETSRKALEAWKLRQIQELGEEGFRRQQELTLSRGSALHAWLEQSLINPEKLTKHTHLADDITRRHIQSVSHILPKVTGVRALESAIHHPRLNYCGIVDCVARLGKTLCLIDWKTSERAKPNLESLYDNPLQLAAYIGAINSDSRYSELGSIHSAAIIVVYNSGWPAVIHRMGKAQIDHYWHAWLARLQQFRQLS